MAYIFCVAVFSLVTQAILVLTLCMPAYALPLLAVGIALIWFVAGWKGVSYAPASWLLRYAPFFLPAAALGVYLFLSDQFCEPGYKLLLFTRESFLSLGAYSLIACLAAMISYLFGVVFDATRSREHRRATEVEESSVGLRLAQ